MSPQLATDHPGRERPSTATGPDQNPTIVLQRRVDNLARALHTRDAIGQAKGVLVAHYGIEADEAFALLTRISQHTNTKLADLALTLVTRVRERRPALPQHCRVVTEVVQDLLERPGHPGAGRPVRDGAGR